MIKNFIGQGFKNSKRYPFILNHFLRNPHVYSPYTPYQSEISQGRLEMLFHYQRMISQLTGKEMAVASLLDAGQVSMDIITMMYRQTKKKIILVDPTLYQPILNCMSLRARHQNIILKPWSGKEAYNMEDVAGIIGQKYSRLGHLNTCMLQAMYHAKYYHPHILTALHSDLLSNYIHTYDAGAFDFIFGNGCDVGIGMNFGGPQPAFLSFNKEQVRNVPGKIITTGYDKYNTPGYRLGLQTREQHIKREKATSNICTNQALLASMSVAHAIMEGDVGLRRSAEDTATKTQYMTTNLSTSNTLQTHSIFDTVSYHVNEQQLRKLNAECIYPHIHNYGSNICSFTVDETTTYEDIDKVIHILTENHNRIKHVDHIISHKTLLKDKIFSEHTSNEQSVLRYLHSLAKKDYSLMNGAIPLGSCTMKHTPVDAMETLMNPEANVHPYTPVTHTLYDSVIKSLTRRLCDITGFDRVFYQSQSGAMGEYAGLSILKKYFTEKEEQQRNIIILPKSAHGTNASTAVLAGFTLKYVKETSDGFIDCDHLDELLTTNKEYIAGLMITYPSTYGLYEKNASIINEKIHACGGLVYMDGANLNALVGKKDESPRDLGFDICHFNLHKTFAIPHGGGGPGMGPIAYIDKLHKYVPQFSSEHPTESISTTPYGSGLILQLSEHYVHNDLSEDKEEILHQTVLSNTNRFIDELSTDYNILHADSEYRAHECIIDVSEFKKLQITETDICKRLMDYGFHGPTMSWPVLSSLMIEITETEPKSEVNRFIDAMKKIRREIDETPELLRNAPHTMRDMADWKYNYTIDEACFPTKNYSTKYWPTINRMNDVESDRTLLKKRKANLYDGKYGKIWR